MPFQGLTAELPCGEAGMVVRPNRHKAQPNELLSANGVTLEDQLLGKEPGATPLDAAGIAGAPLLTYTLSSAKHWAAGLATFRTSSATPFVQKIGTVASASNATAASITVPAGGVAAGNLVVVSVAVVDPFGVAPLLTCADTKGHVYSTVNRAHQTSGEDTVTFFWVLTTALVSGDSITVTSSLPTAIRAIASEFTGVSATPGDQLDRFAINQSGSTHTSTAILVGPTAALVQVPEILVASITYGGTASIGTAGSGFTEVAELGTSMACIQAYRVDTSTPTIIGLYDWNPSYSFAGNGTATVTKGSQTVTGIGSAFLTQLNLGDEIQIGSESHRVTAVASNVSLTVAEPWLVASAGVAYNVLKEQRLVSATSDGALYQELQGNLDFQLLTGALTPDIAPGRFVAGGKESGPANPRKLFWFSGRDDVQVVNGNSDATAAVATPPLDWSGANQPVNGIVHDGHMIGFGNRNFPHQLYASTLTSHENFTGANSWQLTVYSGIGHRLWCAAEYQGLLFVWKYPRGIFYLDDSDLVRTNWKCRPKSTALGCAPTPYAVCPLDDDVLFMAANGSFHLLSAVDTLSGTRASDLSYRLGINKWLRDNLNLSRLRQVVSQWYPHKKVALFSAPSAGSQTNDLLLKFDFGGADTGEAAIRFSYSRRDAASALAVRRDTDTIERLITGEAGFVYIGDQAERNKGGVGYSGSYQTPHLDFSHVDPRCRTRRKIYRFIELVFEPVAAGTVTVQPYVDGRAMGQPLTFDATKRRVRKHANLGDGYTFSLAGSNDVADEDFQILSHIVGFELGDEDQSR